MIPIEEKKYTLVLSSKVDNRLRELATRQNRTITEIVRISLGLAELYFKESEAGNKIVVTTSEGEPIHEIVVPK